MLPEDYNPSSLIFESELLHCETPRPSRYLKKDVTKLNCILTADLRTVDPSQLIKTPKADSAGYGYKVN